VIAQNEILIKQNEKILKSKEKKPAREMTDETAKRLLKLSEELARQKELEDRKA